MADGRTDGGTVGVRDEGRQGCVHGGRKGGERDR